MRIIFLVLSIVSLVFILSVKQSYADEKLVINEAMVHPSSGQNEWVELFGPANLDLTKYWIDDDTNFSSDSGNSYKVSMQSVTAGVDGHHYIVNIPIGIFNNPGDMIVLFDPQGQVVDQYTYASDPGVDITLGRFPDGTGDKILLSDATKGAVNAGPKPTNSPTPTPTPKPTKTPTPTKMPSATPKPKATVTPKPTPTPTAKLIVTPPKISSNAGTIVVHEASVSAFPSAVLGIQTTRTPNFPTRKPTSITMVKSAQSVSPTIPLVGGILLLGCAILLFVRKWKNS